MALQFQDDNITIHKIKCGPYDNNAYLLICPKTNESILIDTPAEPNELIEEAKKTTVKAILITHNHMDHLLGFDDVTAAINAPVGIGEADASALSKPADFMLKNGEDVKAGTISLKAIFTPGHTDGSTCLVTGKHVFTGDTLFPGGPGKTRSPEHLKQIIESINSGLFALSDDTNVFPGHGDDGNIGSSKEEYRVYASKEHPADQSGDVLWLTS